MSGLEILGAFVWIVVTIAVACWGGGLLFGGLLINLLAGSRKVGGGFMQFIGVVIICAAGYSAHKWISIVFN